MTLSISICGDVNLYPSFLVRGNFSLVYYPLPSPNRPRLPLLLAIYLQTWIGLSFIYSTFQQHRFFVNQYRFCFQIRYGRILKILILELKVLITFHEKAPTAFELILRISTCYLLIYLKENRWGLKLTVGVTHRVLIRPSKAKDTQIKRFRDEIFEWLPAQNWNFIFRSPMTIIFEKRNQLDPREEC